MFAAVVVTILVCGSLSFKPFLEARDNTSFGSEEDILIIASFPKEDVPAEKWLRENGWDEQRGSVENFVVKDEALLMRNTNASTMIGIEFDEKIDPMKYQIVEFRIRVDEVPPLANVTDKQKDDSAFRLFILFDKGGWILSPPQTIGYAWDSTKSVGTTGRSESFGKVRYIVIGSGKDGLKEWREYRRNIFEDYKVLFGSDDVPKIVAIGLKCDSNHTSGFSASAIQWIRLVASQEGSEQKAGRE